MLERWMVIQVWLSGHKLHCCNATVSVLILCLLKDLWCFWHTPTSSTCLTIFCLTQTSRSSDHLPNQAEHPLHHHTLMPLVITVCCHTQTEEFILDLPSNAPDLKLTELHEIWLNNSDQWTAVGTRVCFVCKFLLLFVCFVSTRTLCCCHDQCHSLQFSEV